MTTGRSSMAAVSALIFMILLIACITGVTQYGRSMVEQKSNATVNAESTILQSTTTFGSHRKLLFHRDVIGALSAGAAAQVNRIWGDECSKADIVINQGPTDPLPNGIPTYTVEIMNVCTTGCDISGIHMSCGWFSSARLINPRVFKRLRYNDCLVNDGKPLVNGRTISFQYANTFAYPLSISSVVC